MRSVAELRDLIGVPYSPRGRSKDEGFDCYGLVIEVYRRLGLTIPDAFAVRNVELVNRGLAFGKIDKPQQFDLVSSSFCGRENHIGIYIENGRVLHADPSAGVCVVRLSDLGGKIVFYRPKGGG